MRHKLAFVRYILQQEKTCMKYKILNATCENMRKNQFCAYLYEIFNSVKKFLQEKSGVAAFKYLTKEKSKEKQILNKLYDKL